MNAPELVDTSRMLVAGDKGLLAMDESTPTCDKRFARSAIPQTEEARHAYRELIVTTPGLSKSISGAILYDETLRQQTKDGTPFVRIITDAGICTFCNLMYVCGRRVASRRGPAQSG
nr:class I fructose-bisphosphate aldolase [Singulisphaera acidiphila]